MIKNVIAATDPLQVSIPKVVLTPDSLATKIAGWVGGVAGVIVFMFFIYGGFLYLTSAGNTEQAKKGGQTIVNSILGLMILLLSYGVVTSLITVLE